MVFEGTMCLLEDMMGWKHSKNGALVRKRGRQLLFESDAMQERCIDVSILSMEKL